MKKPRLPQKGLRAEATDFAAFATVERAFNQKRLVTWDEVEAFDREDRTHNAKVLDLLEAAHYGLRNYEFYPHHKDRDRYLVPLLRATILMGFDVLNDGEIHGQVTKWRQDRFQSKEAQRNLAWFCDALKGRGQGNRADMQSAQERTQRKRAQRTAAQGHYLSRTYQEKFRAAYAAGKKTLLAKGTATPQHVRRLVEGIVAAATTPQAGHLKRAALDEFRQWALRDIATLPAVIKNSR